MDDLARGLDVEVEGGDNAGGVGNCVDAGLNNVTLSIGVVGVGRWGPNLLRNLHNHRTSEVLLVAELNERRRLQIAELYPDVCFVDDARDVLRDDRVDGVVIATPTRTHFQLVREALLANKHVLVEKPLTDSVDTAIELCELARQRRRTVLVGHVFLYNAGVEYVKDCLDRRVLGDIYYLSMVRTNLGPIRKDVNAAWDLASHDVAIANWWLGASPLSVSASAGTWINPGIADAVFATLEYPSNVVVNMQACWLSPRKVRAITVVGEDRMLTFDDTNPEEPIRIYDKSVVDERVRDEVIDTLGQFRSLVHEGEILIPPVSLGEPLRTECDEFVRSIVTGECPRSGPALAIDIVRTLEAMDRSIERGGTQVKVLT